jgi:histidine triad (HIT) family protein
MKHSTDGNCIFCRIIRGEAPADFLYRDEYVVAFKDIRPRAPIHNLIIPQKHIRSVNELTEQDKDIVASMIFTGKFLAKQLGIHRAGYKLLLNVEAGGGQDIFHIHMHLMAGFSFD